MRVGYTMQQRDDAAALTAENKRTDQWRPVVTVNVMIISQNTPSYIGPAAE